ncbi:MAG: hypothetical protein LBN07_04660 [Christensenellaceae bacterium]|jgi:hypothetical protein|nr:hypothetical protein [Christensenellaceae bacterium]
MAFRDIFSGKKAVGERSRDKAFTLKDLAGTGYNKEANGFIYETAIKLRDKALYELGSTEYSSQAAALDVAVTNAVKLYGSVASELLKREHIRLKTENSAASEQAEAIEKAMQVELEGGVVLRELLSRDAETLLENGFDGNISMEISNEEVFIRDAKEAVLQAMVIADRLITSEAAIIKSGKKGLIKFGHMCPCVSDDDLAICANVLLNESCAGREEGGIEYYNPDTHSYGYVKDFDGSSGPEYYNPYTRSYEYL